MARKKYLILSELNRRMKNKPILVGGSAVELYTVGERESIDIDIIASRMELIPLLEEMGFMERDGTYRKEDVVVDLVGSSTKERVKDVKLKGVDGEIRVIGLEDLVVDRLNACKHWDSDRDCDHAEYLLKIYGETLDEAYLGKRAKEEDVDDVLKKLRKR